MRLYLDRPGRAGQRLSGLWLPVPDGAVGHDVAAGALPLDHAASELLLGFAEYARQTAGVRAIPVLELRRA